MSDFAGHIDAARERYMPAVLELIERTIADGTPAGSSLPEMCAYHLETGGKRLRALLPMMVAEALREDVEAGGAPEELVAFGAACEMIHNATLVHDDLQDGDEVRRGQPTVWVRYGAPRAINLGDAMLYYALLLVERLPHPPELRQQLVGRIARDVIQVVDGQEREFLLKELDRPTLDDYFRMVEGKTSGLFALPLAGGALLAGAPAELVAALEQAARHLGVLFQIQDDVLDLYGDKGRDERGSDIGEGKISVLVVHALAHAAADDARWLRELLRAGREHVDAAAVARVAALFERTGSLRFALDEIARRQAKALDTEAFTRYPRLAAMLGEMAEVFVAPIRHL